MALEIFEKLFFYKNDVFFSFLFFGLFCFTKEQIDGIRRGRKGQGLRTA